MAEWSIAPVLKTDVLKGTGGSNPSLSALKQISLRSLLFFICIFKKLNSLKINLKAFLKQGKQAMSEGSNRSGTDVKKCYFLRLLEKCYKKGRITNC